MTYRILFLGYWNLEDGLTYSTIFPHLRILKELPQVEYLHFANTQRESLNKGSLVAIDELGIDYSPLYSKNFVINNLNKIYDFIHFPRLIEQICKRHKINCIIARGAPAGSLAYLVWKKINVPFVVESFEPHAEYMRAAGVWQSFDLRYLFQKHWEKKQKQNAQALITVALNYKEQLISEGISDSKVYLAPCAVDTMLFYSDTNLRSQMRQSYQIPFDAKVGIYAGKFGGLYLKEEAFTIFKKAFQQISNFHLLLLTNTNSEWLEQQIRLNQLPIDRIIVDFVPYSKVNRYLNMADFAFALYKTNRVSAFLSPVKIGEYWAVGLPVAITPQLGDEYHFIEKERLGVKISFEGWPSSLIKLTETFEGNTEKRSLKNSRLAYEAVLI